MQSECEKLSEQLRQDAVTIIESVWKSIDWDKVSSRRRMKIYEEYQNKIKSASHVGKASHFLEKLCSKMDCTLSGTNSSIILNIIKRIEQDDLDLEFLNTCRSETQLLVLLMREKNHELKENSKQIVSGGG
jgi:hypothetical protein